MNSRLARLLQGRHVLILDGGLATLLERNGVNLQHAMWASRTLLEDWSALVEAHCDFLRHGADVITTATYQASFSTLEDHGITGEKAEEVFVTGVRLAREAIRRHALETEKKEPPRLVAGSLGPYGAALCDGSEYTGWYGREKTTAQLASFHRPRLRALLREPPDLVAFETIPCMNEAQAVISLVAEQEWAETLPPVWIAFACRDGRSLSSGESFADAVRLVASSPSVVAVGINCTHPDHISDLLAEATQVLASLDNPPILLTYANSGEPWVQRDDGTWGWCGGGDFRKNLRERVVTWYAAGARWIGGCCRVFPEDIKEIRASLSAVATDATTDP